MKCILGIVLFFCSCRLADASPLDFSWNSPRWYVHNKGTAGEVRYIVWFYNLGNTTEKPILVPIEVSLLTDTGEKFLDAYYPEIMEHAAKLDENNQEDAKYQYSPIAKGELTSQTTKHCVAMFEDVDPNARRLDILVSGISHFFFWRLGKFNHTYKISYEKDFDHWRLVEHGMIKESMQSSHESKRW